MSWAGNDGSGKYNIRRRTCSHHSRSGQDLLCDDHLVPDYDNRFGWYRTIFDTDGNYAREVEIKTPVTHAECGEAELQRAQQAA